MIPVRIFDKEFGHAKSYSGTNVPKHIQWVRGGFCTFTTFFTNQCLGDFDKTDTCEIKVAWMTEPPSMNPESYRQIIELEHEFDYILTYDHRLLERGKRYLYYPLGGSWISEDIQIPRKTKMVSMISSRKRGCVGYEIRHQIAEDLGHRIEMFGQIVDNPIHCKSEGLLPFRFSVVVENDQLDDYFTEKLVDCLACGTIPFYWGSPKVSNHFNPGSVIPFSTIEDLGKKMDVYLCNGAYEALRDSVNYNMEASKQYRVAEDWIFNRYPHLFT